MIIKKKGSQTFNEKTQKKPGASKPIATGNKTQQPDTQQLPKPKGYKRIPLDPTNGYRM